LFGIKLVIDMCMDLPAFINILTPDTSQVKDFNNLFLYTGNKNINFLEFLKNAFLADAELETKDLNVTFQEHDTPFENKEMLSEIILQLMTWKNQNFSLEEKTKEGLPVILQLDGNSISINIDYQGIDSQEHKEISEQKRLEELLAYIINGMLKSVSKGQRIDKDSNLNTVKNNPLTKDPLENEPHSKEEAKTITINLAVSPCILYPEKQVETETIPLTKDPLENEPHSKEEAKTITINLAVSPCILYPEKQVETETIPLTKDPLENEPHSKEEAKTITINLAVSPCILYPEKQVETETPYTKRPVESKNYKSILFFEGLEKNINKEKLINLGASEKTRTDFDLINKKTLKGDALMTALDEKEIEFKGNLINTELHPSKPKIDWEKKLFEISPDLEVLKDIEKNKERLESKDETLVYERINVYDMNGNNINDIKADETVRISTHEMAEKIEKIMDRFFQSKETSDMVIKFKLNDNDTLYVSLKREGLHISVNIKSANNDVINMFYAHKETIVKSLEEKNIFTEIFVYPDGSQNQKDRQHGGDGRRYYRKRNNDKEFYEVLITQKV